MLERRRRELRVRQIVAPFDRIDEDLGDMAHLLVLHPRLDDDRFAFDVLDSATVQRLRELARAVVEPRPQSDEVALSCPGYDLAVSELRAGVERGHEDVAKLGAQLLIRLARVLGMLEVEALHVGVSEVGAHETAVALSPDDAPRSLNRWQI